MNTNDNLPAGVPPVPTPPAPPVPAPAVPEPVVPVVPVVPTPTPAPTPAPAPSEPVSVTEVVYTGNKAIDIAINTFTSSTGIKVEDLQDAVQKAIQEGKPELIDVAAIKAKCGVHADQAIALAQAAVTDITARAAATRNEVFTLAGGQERWEQAVSVFNTNAPEHVRNAVKVLINSGDLKSGATMLLETVNASGLLPSNNGVVTGTTATGTGTALSAVQFRTEMAALKKEAGNRSLESGHLGQKYNDLMARRAQGRKLGL